MRPEYDQHLSIQVHLSRIQSYTRGIGVPLVSRPIFTTLKMVIDDCETPIAFNQTSGG